MQNQSFNDGLALIYTVKNGAAPGEKPREATEKKAGLRYHERTVGVSRFFAAMQNNVRVDHVIRCPRVKTVWAGDRVILSGDPREKRYVIRQVQYPEDIVPPVMDLTLEEIQHGGA